MKPYWTDDRRTLYHADQVPVGAIPPGHLLVITDPPNEVAGSWNPAASAAAADIVGAALLVNARLATDWIRWTRAPSAVTIWKRPAPTKDGLPFDLMLHLGRHLAPTFVDDSARRDTEHPAERGWRAWGDIMVRMSFPFRNDAVFLDPYAGSGTTLVAARHWDYEAIAVEADERWCQVIVRRLEER